MPCLKNIFTVLASHPSNIAFILTAGFPHAGLEKKAEKIKIKYNTGRTK